MTNDIDIKLIGDKELAEVLRSLNYATQQKVLRGILRDAGNKTIVKALKAVTPVKTGKLKKSMGIITGKAKNTATVFAGPRLSHTKTAAGKAGYSGWVANILEYAKSDIRTPAGAIGGRFRRKGVPKKAFRPFFGTAAGAGFVKAVGPIRKRTNFTFAIKSNISAAEIHVTKSIRTVIERTWKRKSKSMAGGYQSYGQWR